MASEHKGLFPSTQHLQNQPEAIFSLSWQDYTEESLRFCSNIEYELYINGALKGLGGQRCTLYEAYVDTWQIPKGERNEITIRLHWINPAVPSKELPLYRSVFPSPFFVCFHHDTKWQCFLESDIVFGAKMSSQLARQNIINGVTKSPVNLVAVDISKWNLVPLPVEHLSVLPVEPYQITEGTIHRQLKGSNKNQNVFSKGSDVADYTTRCEKLLYYATYDLHSIGHSKVIIHNNPAPDLVIVYSEVSSFDHVWATSNRHKVRMADAVLVKSGNPFGYRGCRYIHFVSSNPDTSLYKYDYP